VEGIRQIDR